MARIEGVNEENIQSPISAIAPRDTAQIPFYVISRNHIHQKK